LSSGTSRGAAPQSTPVHFLRDAAADEDFFGSHARVADAIISIVDADDRHNVIGLLGPWGSGKSTVIKLLERKLVENQKPTLLFTYDAWLHQSDPPRRAFLERFLAFLQSHSLATDEKWKEAMDVLNRRVEETETTTTPTLTIAGYLILLSLLLVPFGSSFLDADWLGKMMTSHWKVLNAWGFPFGATLTLLPVIITVSFYYLWRPVRCIFSGAFWSSENWTRHRPPHQDQSLLAIIANKQVERQKNRVVKTPDPTTIEFQTTFREMILAAARDGHRLLIVVDNLDRLPGAEAIDMWTTIRSFFLGAIPVANPTDGGPPSLLALPTIILPIDTHALERVFDGGELGGSKAVAQSFMDKTFDVTFHVSPPVLSEWHAYLAKLMREALGDKLTDQWSADVGRIFEKRNIPRVTPRDLNRMVNAIAALWLQWEPVGIPFLTVAYYAMMRQGFDPNYMQAINSPAFDLSEHDPNWQRSLAALHFGVEPKASLQILLEPELRSAILDCNHQVFKSQVQTKGFEQVLYGQIDTPDTMERGLANLCELLDQAAVDEQLWADFTWRKIRHVFLRTDLGDDVHEKASTALKILVARLPAHELGNFLREAGQRMTVPAPGVTTRRTSLAPYRALLSAWLDAAPQPADPTLQVMIRDPSVYLDLASVAVRSGSAPYIKTSVAPDVLTKMFAERAFHGNADWDYLDEAMLVLQAGADEDALAVLADAMKGLIASQSADQAATEGAVHILGSLRSAHEFAQQALTELADAGQLSQRANEAFNLPDERLAARLTALCILTRSGLPAPPNMGWDEYLAKKADFVGMLDADLRAYGDAAYFGQLAHLARYNDNARPLSMAILERRRSSEGLGPVDAGEVVAEINLYLDLLAESDRAQFVADVSTQPGFWEQLYARHFDEGAIMILRMLIGSDHQHSEARNRARQTLRIWLNAELGAKRWEDEVRNGESLLDLADELQNLEKRPLALKDDGVVALKALFGQLTGNPSHALRKRWFRLAHMLAAKARKSLLTDLRDHILASAQITDPLAFFDMAGAFLLTGGEFAARADESLRLLVMPQLQSIEGLGWLQRDANPIAHWIAKASQPLRNELANALAADPGDGNEAAREMRAALAGRWKLMA
jgi:hypothetical protein